MHIYRRYRKIKTGVTGITFLEHPVGPT